MLYFLFLLFCLVLDQMVKLCVVVNETPYKVSPLIPYKVDLLYAQNYGSSFAFVSDNRLLLISVSLFLFCTIFLCLYVKRYKHPFTNFSLLLILGGGLGNLLDRLWLGYVIDMFRVRSIYIPAGNGQVLYPIFNIADIFIYGGCIVFLISGLLLEKTKKKKQRSLTSLSSEEIKFIPGEITGEKALPDEVGAGGHAAAEETIDNTIS